MKRLSLLRHAEAASRALEMRDIDRPLTAKGRNDAILIARHIAGRNRRPDLALSSPSVRTRQTLRAVCACCAEPLHVELEDAIYNATPQQLLGVVEAAPDQYTHLLLVGHNPGMHLLAMGLAGAGDDHAMTKLRRSFPKGALAEFEFDVASWREIEFGAGVLTGFIRPKQLR